MFRKMAVLAIVLVFAGAASCARPPRTTPPPVRDADIYPGAEKNAGLTAAVDDISDPDRVRQYFGADLTKDDILPVMILLSNHGDDRFTLSPSDVLVTDGDRVLDPLPADAVARMIRGGLPQTINSLSQEVAVQPEGRYQGLMYFRVPKTGTGLYSKMEKFFAGRLTMRITVTDQDSGERIHFGPFPLSGF